MITLKQLGIIIRHHRQKAKITQLWLAAKLKIPQGTISKIELGKVETGFRNFLKICKILDIPVASLDDTWERIKEELKNE